MKLKNKILTIIVPTILTGTVAPLVMSISSCTNNTKKEDTKYPTKTIKMDKVTNLKDINNEYAPFCALNTDPYHSSTLIITVPSSTTTKLFYQKGSFDPDDNSITWPDSWTAVTEDTTIDHLDYLTPLRFYAYNPIEVGKFSEDNEKGGGQFKFKFSSASRSKFPKGKGIRLAGSLRSLLATKAIEGDKVEALEDLNDCSSFAFSNLFCPSDKSESDETDICEVNPGFLPFKTMKPYCYAQMFMSNQSLLTAPDLPSKDLATGCYYCMFTNCKGLQNAPYLPATILEDECYEFMFAYCNSLTSVSLAYPGTFRKEYFLGWLTFSGTDSVQPTIFYDGFDTTYTDERKKGYTSDWIPDNFKIVSKADTDPEWLEANTTVFEFKDDKVFGTATSQLSDYYPAKIRAYKSDPVSVIIDQIPLSESLTTIEDRSIYKKNETTNEPEKIKIAEIIEEKVTTLPNTMYIRYCKENDVVDPLCVNIVAEQDNTTVKINTLASGATIYKYVKDTEKWEVLSKGSSVTLAKDEVLKLYGDVKTSSTTSYTQIKISGKAKLDGNIMALLSTTEKVPATALPRDYCFAYLFKDSTGITSIGENFFPQTITTLTKGCYYHMFDGCTNLTKGPTKLPATTLLQSCYEGMYYNCSSLGSVPTLSTTTLAASCYKEMFYGCESLVEVPKDYLPFTTLTAACYRNMFKGCKKLTQAPDLPAQTLTSQCYFGMFQTCQSLKIPPMVYNGAQTTDSTKAQEYDTPIEYMFEGCSSLKVSKTNATGTKKFMTIYHFTSRDKACPDQIIYNTHKDGYQGERVGTVNHSVPGGTALYYYE